MAKFKTRQLAANAMAKALAKTNTNQQWMYTNDSASTDTWTWFDNTRPTPPQTLVTIFPTFQGATEILDILHPDQITLCIETIKSPWMQLQRKLAITLPCISNKARMASQPLKHVPPWYIDIQCNFLQQITGRLICAILVGGDRLHILHPDILTHHFSPQPQITNNTYTGPSTGSTTHLPLIPTVRNVLLSAPLNPSTTITTPTIQPYITSTPHWGTITCDSTESIEYDVKPYTPTYHLEWK